MPHRQAHERPGWEVESEVLWTCRCVNVHEVTQEASGQRSAREHKSARACRRSGQFERVLGARGINASGRSGQLWSVAEVW